jgi:hypothetical protein
VQLNNVFHLCSFPYEETIFFSVAKMSMCVTNESGSLPGEGIRLCTLLFTIKAFNR